MHNLLEPQQQQQHPAVKLPDELPSERVTRFRPARVSLVGAVFIVAGVASLLAIATQSALLGILVVPLLGVLFLAVALVTGRYAAFIPGSILTGLGMGLLVYQLWLTGAPASIQGSLPLLGLGLGFVAITPLCWYVNHVQLIWPLFFGAVFLISGIGLLFGATMWGEVAGPLVLVAIGCYLLFWRASHPRDRVNIHHHRS